MAIGRTQLNKEYISKLCGHLESIKTYNGYDPRIVKNMSKTVESIKKIGNYLVASRENRCVNVFNRAMENILMLEGEKIAIGLAAVTHLADEVVLAFMKDECKYGDESENITNTFANLFYETQIIKSEIDSFYFINELPAVIYCNNARSLYKNFGKWLVDRPEYDKYNDIFSKIKSIKFIWNDESEPVLIGNPDNDNIVLEFSISALESMIGNDNDLDSAYFKMMHLICDELINAAKAISGNETQAYPDDRQLNLKDKIAQSYLMQDIQKMFG